MYCRQRVCRQSASPRLKDKASHLTAVFFLFLKNDLKNQLETGFHIIVQGKAGDSVHLAFLAGYFSSLAWAESQRSHGKILPPDSLGWRKRCDANQLL